MWGLCATGVPALGVERVLDFLDGRKFVAYFKGNGRATPVDARPGDRDDRRGVVDVERRAFELALQRRAEGTFAAHAMGRGIAAVKAATRRAFGKK